VKLWGLLLKTGKFTIAELFVQSVFGRWFTFVGKEKLPEPGSVRPLTVDCSTKMTSRKTAVEQTTNKRRTNDERTTNKRRTNDERFPNTIRTCPEHNTDNCRTAVEQLSKECRTNVPSWYSGTA